jgi:PAS domain S-box-containing protein
VAFAPIPSAGYVNLYFSDITESKAAAEALRQSEDRFRTLTSHAPVGIFLSDAKGDSIYVNESWCAMAGLRPEEARGRNWLKAVHPEDRERVAFGWEDAVSRRDKSNTEFRFQRRDGGVTWVQGNAIQLRDENGFPRLHRHSGGHHGAQGIERRAPPTWPWRNPG